MASTLFGVPFFSGTAEQALVEIRQILERPRPPARPFVIFTPNTEQLMLAKRNPEFLAALQRADLNLPDSTGVIWAAQILKLNPPLRARIAGREFVTSLVEELMKGKHRLFLLGGGGDTAMRAAHQLSILYPRLELAFFRGAADALAETPREASDALDSITIVKPDVVLVAYGAPAQEFWILKYIDELAKRGVRVVMAVGGTLDVLAGNLKPVPNAVSSAGLEWLWRLVQQPWRIKRQLALPQFVFEVLKKKNRTQP